MRERGALTIAQDEESSVVYGMPGEAIRLGGARCVLAPDAIAAAVRHQLEGCSGLGETPGASMYPARAAGAAAG